MRLIRLFRRVWISADIQVQPTCAVQGNTRQQDGSRLRIAGEYSNEPGERGRDHQGESHSVERSKHLIRLRPVGPLFVLLALAISSCAAGGESAAVSTTTFVATTTNPATPTTATSERTPSPTPTSLPLPTLGLISPSGVPVAVLEETRSGFLIMTPCGFESEIGGGTRLGPTTVVLDPGHGGDSDTGAVGSNGLAEKQINLHVATATAEVLTERGISSVLTRVFDYTSPLFVRANLADTLQAEVMVSIHHNAPTPGPSDEPGVEVFIQSESDSSARLGGLLWQGTKSALAVFDVSWTAAADAGVMTVLNNRGHDAYGIIRHPETPTALIELGYISNPPEAELYTRPAYVQAASRALADAIEQYLSTDDRGAGFVEGRVFNPQPGVGQEVCTDRELG